MSNIFKIVVMTVALVAALALTLESAAAGGRYYHGHRGYYGYPGVTFGFAYGLGLGVPYGAYYYAPPPVYYSDPEPDCAWEYARVWRYGRWRLRRIWRCW